MNETNRELANRIRRMVAGESLPAEARDVLGEYQRRADVANKRLNTAAEWLRHGLLAEAIALTEEYPDSLDAARDLELGRTAAEQLAARCREKGIDSPVGLDFAAAWELNLAFSAHDAARELQGRYRAACLAGASIAERLASLSEACAAVAGKRAELGRIGESIERSLAGQARELVGRRITELAQLADDATKRNASSSTPAQVATTAKLTAAFDQGYRALISAIETLNNSHAELKLDYGQHAALKELAASQDLLELRAIVNGMPAQASGHAEATAQGDVTEVRAAVERMRTGLRRIDDVLSRGLVSIDKAVPAGTSGVGLRDAIEEIRRIVRQADDEQSEVKRAQKELWDLIGREQVTISELNKVYALASGGGLTIPDDLNDAYQSKLAKLLRDRLRHRQMVALRSGVAILSIAITVATLVWAWHVQMGDSNRIRKLARDANDALRAGEVDRARQVLFGEQIAVTDSSDSQEEIVTKQTAALRKVPQGKEAIDRLEEAERLVTRFEEKAKGLLSGNMPKDLSVPATLRAQLGRDLRDLVLARDLVDLATRGVASGLGTARLEWARALLRDVEGEHAKYRLHEHDLRLAAEDIAQSVKVNLAQERDRGSVWLLGQYNRAIQDWLSAAKIEKPDNLDQVVERLTAVASDEVASEMGPKFHDLVSARDELGARLEMVRAASDPSTTFKGFIDKLSTYGKIANQHRPAALADVPRAIRDNEAAMRQVAQAIDAFASSAKDQTAQLHPKSKKVAETQAAACDGKFAAIYPGVSADDFRDLGAFYTAQAIVLGGEDPLGLNDIRSEFTKGAWRQLGSKADISGKTYYSLGGQFSPQEAGCFNLTRCVANCKEFYDPPAKGGTVIINLGMSVDQGAVRLDDMGLGRVADEIVSILNSAKSSNERQLTAKLLIAQRIITSKMPGPLKAQRLSTLLDPKRMPVWPDCDEFKQIVELVRAPQSGLDESARWSHEWTGTNAVRDAQQSFEKVLRQMPDFEKLAQERLARVEATSRRLSTLRFFGLAWTPEPGGVVLRNAAAGKATSGVVLVVTGSADRLDLREVGRVSESGGVRWSATAPADGTPLLMREDDPR